MPKHDNDESHYCRFNDGCVEKKNAREVMILLGLFI